MKVEPFIKWFGGKRKMLPRYEAAGVYPPDGFDKTCNTFFEPFLGGGAMFLDLQPSRAVLTDSNPDLILAWLMVRDYPRQLVEQVQLLVEEQERDGAHVYYVKRDLFNSSRADFSEQDSVEQVKRAALFIYLNKTCFNGLWRVNRKGDFNNPAGIFNPRAVINESNILAISELLPGMNIARVPFHLSADLAQPKDFVFLDPPYYPTSHTSRFTSYTPGGFSDKDQVLVRDVFETLARRGCFVLATNADVAAVWGLYEHVEGVHIHRVKAPRRNTNGLVTELAITNY